MLIIIVCFHLFAVANGSLLRSQSCARKMSILQTTKDSVEAPSQTKSLGMATFSSILHRLFVQFQLRPRLGYRKSFRTIRTPTSAPENKPKEYPNSNNIMGRFLRTGFVWVRHVNNSGNFDPRGRLGDKCKAQLAEPSKELFRSNSHLGDKCKE